MDKNSEKKRTKISSVNRALDIMELLCQEERLMGINEIAQFLGEYQSTIHRSISTLKERGYVYQDMDSSKYGLSYKLCMLGKSVSENSALIQLAKPYAIRIAKEFRETVNIAVREYTEGPGYYAVTILQERGGKRALGVTETLGKPYECYYSGVGKALLAFSEDYDEDAVRRIELKRHTDKSIVDPERFIEEIAKIRELGYAVDNEENEKGLYCLACPVLKSKKKAVMAISVSGYMGQIHDIGIEKIIHSLQEVSAEMSQQLL
ncbi:IclR family transcriptional regulator [Bacilliculturomica massiliensis]|uniref:IclR family transcriptional regulator n=1 Tax=Bacilliculturomica massiliensis TaxID=1917867 RepID=UPI00103087D3|nr:IclR family transcriptional regulator [Bacilliculturomica massiliensis]